MLILGCGSSFRTARNRCGTASVELAVCLPVLVLISLGSIEATNAIFLKERLTSAAYEGARAATTPGQTSAGATAAANSVLTQFNISGGAITITPTVTASTTSGTPITVSVSAPFSSNACIQSIVIGQTIGNITSTVVMNHQ